ncbi:MAG: DNA polymerase IV [Candidatus Bathyarchaeota archaeon]|nr:MAG: DNA polymerase IV [Candidatus Bathyarchaeota archaeon]
MKSSCRKKDHIILHVDMDHFFSAVEEREHPEFKGKPVVLGASPKGGKGRGVVKTCNYEAREFGIHSGMPISMAWKLCPDAIYIQGNYQLYKEVSKSIMAILRKRSDRFQQCGLDEAFLDVSAIVQNFKEAVKLAESIRHEILWNEKLTCSIGIAPNKLVAKIASDHKKPEGLTVVTQGSIKNFLAPLPVQRMIGIGEKTATRLNQMGVSTIGDLASFNASVLVERFGVMGTRYHQFAHGAYESEVVGKRRARKSLGHESTFEIDTSNHGFVLQRLFKLCRKVHERAIRRSLLFRTVTVKMRHQNFRTHTHGKTLPFSTNRLENLWKVVQELAQDNLSGYEKIRLVGVRVSNLRPTDGQTTLA